MTNRIWRGRERNLVTKIDDPKSIPSLTAHRKAVKELFDQAKETMKENPQGVTLLYAGSVGPVDASNRTALVRYAGLSQAEACSLILFMVDGLVLADALTDEGKRWLYQEVAKRLGA